ncbi:MAG: hypothetical protein ACJARD_000081 [Alphaproteobacteria bacterium]|jgi:hypothetical protein
MFVLMQHRPLMIAERHNASRAAYFIYLYLKKNPAHHIDFCLFEGATTPQQHLDQCQNAFDLYHYYISAFLNTTNKKQIYAYLQYDLWHEKSDFTEYAICHQPIDSKKHPHGFGQIRNLVAHFLIYHQLERYQTIWIAIDDKRKIIKKIAKQKVIDGTAYLYKKHRYVGNASTIGQKTLLEAAIIRSKFMSDHILNYAHKGRVLCLVGNRHAYDITCYTPDLVDVFGYHPHNDADHALYHYNVTQAQLSLTKLDDNQEISPYCRKVSLDNTKRLQSSFDLKSDYLSFFYKKLR